MPTIKFFLFPRTRHTLWFDKLFFISPFSKVNTLFVLCPKRKAFTICMHDSMAFTFPDPPSNLRFKETTTITTSPMTPRAWRSEAWALTEAQPERRQRWDFFATLHKVTFTYSTISSNFCPLFTDIDIGIVYVWWFVFGDENIGFPNGPFFRYGNFFIIVNFYFWKSFKQDIFRYQ